MCRGPRAAYRAVPGASCFISSMLALPLAAAALGAWAYGTYEPNSPLFGRVIGRGSRRGRVAYLTFDDGPNAGATEPILATLAAHQVPAAFFLVGGHVRRMTATGTTRTAIAGARRRLCRGSSPTRTRLDTSSARSPSSHRDGAPLALALALVAGGADRRGAGTQVPRRLSLACDRRRPVRGGPVAPGRRPGRQSFLARREGLGVASDPQAGGSAQLARGPGGEPRRLRRQRSLGRGRGRGGAGAPDRPGGGRAGRGGGLLGGMDAGGRGARAGRVPGDGAERARA